MLHTASASSKEEMLVLILEWDSVAADRKKSALMVVGVSRCHERKQRQCNDFKLSAARQPPAVMT